MAEFKASTIRIKNKTKAKNKCSSKLRGKKKFRIKAGMMTKSSSLKAISYLSIAKMPSSAYLALLKNEYFGFKVYPFLKNHTLFHKVQSLWKNIPKEC